jgi:predicted Zn finger-like uncharacterized protein
MWKKAVCRATSRFASLVRPHSAGKIRFRMIIACPACATRYVVPDSAIGAEGRTVRCAKCRHSWFQDGPVLELAEAVSAADRSSEAPSPQAAPAAPVRTADPLPKPAPPASAHVSQPEPFAEPEAAPVAPPVAASEPPVFAQPAEPAPTVVEVAQSREPAVAEYDEEISQFDYAPPFRPRRNVLKVWTIAAGVFAALALGTVVAVSYFGLPDWVPVSRPTFALGQADLVLDFPRTQQERRTLPNGTEYFGASGTVKNVGRETRSLPSILIVLRDARERIVYSWEIAPPKPSLAPGETVTINEAVTDVPRSAKIAEIGWNPD